MEFTGWIANDPPIHRRLAALSLVLLGYPTQSPGFHVKSAFGGVRAIAEDDLVVVLTDALFGQAGIGWDVRFGAGMLTPFVNYQFSFAGRTTANDVLLDEVVLPNALQFGLGITFH